MPATQTALASPPRLAGAVALALLTLLFNYGTQVTTVTDAVLWFTVSVVIGYAAFTVLGVVADIIWE
ncbi:hypothetical protein [Salinibaculum rarum]|uniref:hypothetical protein n=1 Tax=Salinibaculum rarum TaxID=3058903 RepID=UPI0026602E5A|nr:hypothetical protein [Salinibaculum sp. KK48]